MIRTTIDIDTGARSRHRCWILPLPLEPVELPRQAFGRDAARRRHRLCTPRWQHIPRGGTFHCPKTVGRQDVRLTLKDAHSFQWEQIGPWYFLELHLS